MPFVKRVVQPTLLCRASDTARTQAGAAPAGRLLQDDSELVAVNNCALSNIIRQLSSLAGHADEIFGQLKAELGQINARASGVRERLESLQARAEDLNARTVTVPEGDLTTYWQHKAHFFKAKQPIVSGLFTPESRPIELQRLYDAAGQTPVLKMRQMDRLRRDGKRASKIFMCTPVLSTEENRKARKRSALTDIETSKPASLSRIREWRSSEVLGSAVAPPDVSLAAPVNASDLLEHLLPSPEEQLSVIARHFPPEMVAVDVTGRNFDRQQRSRRSLSQIDTRRAERHRKRRSLRRNTIAGTSEAELLRQAADGASQLGGSESIEVDSSLQSLPGSKRKLSSDKVSDRVLSHLNSLREWGRLRLSRAREQQQPTDLYETLTHIRRPRSTSPHVRLRAHAGRKNKLDVHSSSGNWSASSSSARASVESSSDHRTTSHLPTSSSSSTCDSALSVRRTKVALSISSSNSRESPDLHVSDSTGFNDGETSSIYSCDTEGYYTSFHVDSGLKTLREEPLESTNSSGNITVCAAAISTKALTCENEYELFGKGSTSTTASSAGTICTVKAPPSPPLRKSSLEHLDVSSDAEAVERRARVRKALDTNRVPSMCVITPPQSEDEQAASPVGSPPPEPQKRASPQLRALLPFNNIVGRVRDALRKSPQKESLPPTPVESPVDEYVTIASTEAAVRVAQGEYVSLNELPLGGGDSGSEGSAKSPANSLERRRRNAGARVLLDSDGKVVYSSDSLRRKPKNTTFEPGPCVKTESPPTRAHQRVIIKAKDVPCTSPPATSAACKAGPHVDMLKLIEQEQQQGEEAHARSENIDPQSWARIRRNESYRLAASQHNNPQQQQPPPPSAAEDVKRVLNPNTAGRRFYGAKIMVDPGRMGRPLHGALYEPHGSPLGRVTLPSDTQRARVLGSGLSNGTNGFHQQPYTGHSGVYTNTYGGSQHLNAPFWTMPRSTMEPGVSSLSSTPTKHNFRMPDCNLSPISSPSSPLASPGARRPLFNQPRSTMSTDELYAAIHKSKKKMNIKDSSPVTSSCSSPVDCDRASPAGPPGTPGSRHSWSPSSAEALNGVSVSARNSFKRLLLEKGCQKGKERRMSAVEQLMATKGQFAPSQRSPQQTLHHSLSRRRYRHTDVLSTTIAEESEPQAYRHVTASYLQHRIDQMCLSPRLSASRTPIIITKPPSPSKMSLETSL